MLNNMHVHYIYISKTILNSIEDIITLPKESRFIIEKLLLSNDPTNIILATEIIKTSDPYKKMILIKQVF